MKTYNITLAPKYTAQGNMTISILGHRDVSRLHHYFDITLLLSTCILMYTVYTCTVNIQYTSSMLCSRVKGNICNSERNRIHCLLAQNGIDTASYA